MSIYQKREELLRIILETSSEEKLSALLELAKRPGASANLPPIQKADLSAARTGLEPFKTLEEHLEEQKGSRIPLSEAMQVVENTDWGDIQLNDLLDN